MIISFLLAIVACLSLVCGEPICGTTDCNDMNECTIDTCDESIPIASGGPCVHTPVVCDDNLLCTTDSCNAQRGCVFSEIQCHFFNLCEFGQCNPNTGRCEPDPSDPCFVEEMCIVSVCDPFTGSCRRHQKDCNDNNACTTDECLPFVGCDHLLTVHCNDDGNLCTDDYCNPIDGNCIHPPVNCDDRNSCTDDSCVANRGCRHDPIDCGDGDACTIELGCNPEEGCGYQQINCDDGNACTEDDCNPANGRCINQPVNCDDSNVCTNEFCNPADGRCSRTAVVCDDDNACTMDSCIPKRGCIFSPVVCNDLSACTVDSCNPDSGCAFSPIVCEDGNACTDDVCNPAGGTCSHPPIVCVDTDACTDDLCDSDFGCVFETTDCDDNDACTEESCDSTNGCVYVPIATVVNPGDCPGNTYAFAIDDEDGGGIACIDFGGDKRSTPNTCPDRVAITGSGAPPLLVGSPSVSSVVFTGGQCAFEFDNLGHMTSFELLSSGGYLFELTEECGVFLVVERALRKREEVVVGSNGIGTFQLQGIGQGDPHFVTPWGARFDFDGEASANYALFVAPHVQINMQLAATGPTTRFMTSIAVMFGNETFVFHARVGAFNNAPAVARALEARGGSAVLTDGWLLQMFLCDGIDVEVSVRHLEQTNFLNVKFITPGCMKTVGGALGHTYDCKYEVAPQTFKWAHELEESFRIVELTSTVAPFGREVKPKCHSNSEKAKLSQKKYMAMSHD
jgi:hypothetical protein